PGYSASTRSESSLGNLVAEAGGGSTTQAAERLIMMANRSRPDAIRLRLVTGIFGSEEVGNFVHYRRAVIVAVLFLPFRVATLLFLFALLRLLPVAVRLFLLDLHVRLFLLFFPFRFLLRFRLLQVEALSAQLGQLLEQFALVFREPAGSLHLNMHDLIAS